MKKAFRFLNKPYPLNDDLKHNAKIILFLSIGIFAFLSIFQPVGISSFTKNEIIYLVFGLAATIFFVLTLNLIVLPSMFPKFFNTNKWDIKREIFWNIWMLLSISSSALLVYSKILGPIDIHFSDVLKIILIASIPVAVLITINHDRLLRSHLKSAQLLNKKLIEKKEQSQKLVHFESEYKNDEITLKPDTISVIKSADNYIEIYYEREGALRKHIIRSTLNKAETAIRDCDFLIRCHRSYIVNIKRIKEIQGNSQGYRLYFEHLDFPVQVSQMYIAEFKRHLE
jgi:hypothetical protein